MPKVIPPTVTLDDRFFWEGVEAGELRLQRCAGCGALQHPPTPMCPACHSVERTWAVSPGRGTIASWLVSRHPTEPDAEPRVVVLVDLDEGVRLVSNLVGADPDAGEVADGMAVVVDFATVDGVPLHQFRPAAEAS